jgi:hypothetical protein
VIELKDTPLKRGLPGTPYYVELFHNRFVLRVKGSRREGVTIFWLQSTHRHPPPSIACKDQGWG